MKQYNFICQVQSHSNANVKYTIKMDEKGLLSCNCKAWIYNQSHDRTCKHINSIRGTVDMNQGGMVGKSEGIPKVCYNYPTKCDECHFRFRCYTSRDINVIGRE